MHADKTTKDETSLEDCMSVLDQIYKTALGALRDALFFTRSYSEYIAYLELIRSATNRARTLIFITHYYQLSEQKSVKLNSVIHSIDTTQPYNILLFT